MKEPTTKTQNKQAVIYCRVSTKEQVDEGNSLVSQERICREYATKEGFEVIEVFIEKGESAKTTDRKELKRLLSFCTTKRGNVHAVIAYKVDRISRNIADYSYIRVKLKKFGVEIKSVTEYFEDTPAGRFMENIIANVGQFDNDVRTERSTGGMREAVNEGRYVWMAPVGYDNVKSNGKSTIAPNKLAPLMKEVFERIAERVDSTDAIRLLMAQKGLVGKKGNPIARSNFFRAVRNPLYKGLIKKFGVTLKGAFEPIVSEELFEEVQFVLSGRKNKVKYYTHENPDFPLRRFVLNENGKQLTGYWSKGKRLRYPYYTFSAPGTTIRKEVLENKFMDFQSLFEFDNSYLNAIRYHLKFHFEKRIASQEDERNIIEKRLGEINGQIDKHIDLQAHGAISIAILAQRVKRFEYELEHLNELLKNRPVMDVNIADLLDFAGEVLKQPAMLWHKSPFAIKKKLQVFEFPEGIIYSKGIFRTPKMCNIFKLKAILDSNFGQVGYSKVPGKNTLSRTNMPPSDLNLLETKVFWEEIVEELVHLRGILTGESSQITVDEDYFE